MMKTYSCGNCGYILPEPVGRCPRCGVLLQGEREGDEAERQRLERAYRRNSPAARARREKLEMIGSEIGVILLVVLVIAVFVGGCGALGWFVLPQLLGHEARLPLTVGSVILGGTMLLGIGRWLTVEANVYSPFRSPEKPWEKAEREHRSGIWALTFIFCFVLVPLLGVVGWKFPITVLTPLIPLGIFLKRKLGWDWWSAFSLPLMTLVAISEALSRYLSANELSNPNMPLMIAAIAGMVAAPVLAYYSAKLLAGPAPDTRKMRQEMLLRQVIQNPSSLKDLDRWDQEFVLFELQNLAQAAPEAWKRLSPELQALIPQPAVNDTGDKRKSGRTSTSRLSKKKGNV